MDKNKETQKCYDFLLLNGWHISDESVNEWDSFIKINNIGVDFNDGEMVLIGDVGDFYSMPISYYGLIGVLLESKAIAMDYKTIKH